MARPKRKMAEDTAAQGPAKVHVMDINELQRLVLQLHDQARLDQAAWVAVEEAFDRHATRIEELSHQDLQWNDDFARTFDGVRKTVDQMDQKLSQQIGQVVLDLTATVRKAEADLIVVIKEADGEFAKFRKEIKDRVDETRDAFHTVEKEFETLNEQVEGAGEGHAGVHQEGLAGGRAERSLRGRGDGCARHVAAEAASAGCGSSTRWSRGTGRRNDTGSGSLDGGCGSSSGDDVGAQRRSRSGPAGTRSVGGLQRDGTGAGTAAGTCSVGGLRLDGTGASTASDADHGGSSGSAEVPGLGRSSTGRPPTADVPSWRNGTGRAADAGRPGYGDGPNTNARDEHAVVRLSAAHGKLVPAQLRFEGLRDEVWPGEA